MNLISFLSVLHIVWQSVSGDFRLQILHVSDVHSRFEETDTYSSPCSAEYAEQKKCFGGLARMKKAADDAAQEARNAGIPSLFVNGGDNFRGTVYYTMYKWEVVADLVGRMGFDAITLGNHEFDNGIDNLAMFLENISSPVVSSNLNITSEPRLDLGSLKKSTVVDVGGTKIGVLGYLSPETMFKAPTENLRILSEIPSVREEAKRLKSQGVKIIVVLGHSDLETDMRMAKEVEEISLVIGGHSHSLFYTPKEHPPSTEIAISDYPMMIFQQSGKKVPIVHAYSYGKYLGKLTVRFDDNGDVISATGNPQLLDGTLDKDVEMDHHVSKWRMKINKEIKQVKGYTRVFLGKTDFTTGQLESNLANLITDAFLDQGVEYAKANQMDSWTRASIAIYTNGGVQSVIDHRKNGGALTVEDLFNVLPYENQVIEISFYGSVVKRILEISVSAYDPALAPHYISNFLHFSGMRVVYDFNQPAGSRVKSVEILCTYCDIPVFEPLQNDKIYNIITVDYWLEKVVSFSSVKDAYITKTVLGFRDIDVLIKYVEKISIIYPKLDNRIKVLGYKTQTSSSSSIELSHSEYLFSTILISSVLSKWHRW